MLLVSGMAKKRQTATLFIPLQLRQSCHLLFPRLPIYCVTPRYSYFGLFATAFATSCSSRDACCGGVQRPQIRGRIHLEADLDDVMSLSNRITLDRKS